MTLELRPIGGGSQFVEIVWTGDPDSRPTLAEFAYTMVAVTLAAPLYAALDVHRAEHGCVLCPVAWELIDLLPSDMGDRR